MKLGRLIIDIAGLELSAEDEDILKHPSVGGVILFARNFDNINQVHNLINRIFKLIRLVVIWAGKSDFQVSNYNETRKLFFYYLN